MGSATISVDEFQALEQKVLQTVELIKKEREARAAAEAEVKELRGKLATASAAQSEVESLQREREAVRQRVEKMVAQMDALVSE